MKDSVRCRGAWGLGNNCGECGHCKETAKVAVAVIRELRDEVARLKTLAALPRLEAAVRKLAADLKGDSNVQAVGEGNGEIVLYVLQKTRTAYQPVDGFPVRVVVSGKIIPAGAKGD